MKVNLVPFMLLASLAGMAYLFAGVDGVCEVCSAWCVVVAFGTILHMTRVIRAQKWLDIDRRSNTRKGAGRSTVDKVDSLVDQVASVVDGRR